MIPMRSFMVQVEFKWNWITAYENESDMVSFSPKATTFKFLGYSNFLGKTAKDF